MIKLLIMLTSLCLASLAFAQGYDRKVFNYQSYKPNTAIGFYTNQSCDFINIDHVVSLKDAYDSGAAYLSASEKEVFATIGLTMCRPAPV